MQQGCVSSAQRQWPFNINIQLQGWLRSYCEIVFGCTRQMCSLPKMNPRNESFEWGTRKRNSMLIQCWDMQTGVILWRFEYRNNVWHRKSSLPSLYMLHWFISWAIGGDLFSAPLTLSIWPEVRLYSRILLNKWSRIVLGLKPKKQEQDVETIEIDGHDDMKDWAPWVFLLHKFFSSFLL